MDSYAHFKRKGRATLGHFKSGHFKSGHFKSGHFKSGHFKSCKKKNPSMDPQLKQNSSPAPIPVPACAYPSFPAPLSGGAFRTTTFPAAPSFQIPPASEPDIVANAEEEFPSNLDAAPIVSVTAADTGCNEPSTADKPSPYSTASQSSNANDCTTFPLSQPA